MEVLWILVTPHYTVAISDRSEKDMPDDSLERDAAGDDSGELQF